MSPALTISVLSKYRRILATVLCALVFLAAIVAQAPTEAATMLDIKVSLVSGVGGDDDGNERNDPASRHCGTHCQGNLAGLPLSGSQQCHVLTASSQPVPFAARVLQSCEPSQLMEPPRT